MYVNYRLGLWATEMFIRMQLFVTGQYDTRVVCRTTTLFTPWTRVSAEATRWTPPRVARRSWGRPAGPAPDVGKLSAGRGDDGGLGGAGQQQLAHVRRLVLANSRVTRDGAVSLDK